MAHRNCIFEIVMKGLQAGRPVAHVLHWRQNDGDADAFDSIDMGVFVETWRNLWQTQFSTTQSSTVAYSQMILTLYDVLELVPFHGLRPHPTNQFVRDVTGVCQGVIGGEALPNFNAINVQKRTAVPGRSFRGSLHIPGIPETQSSGNFLTNAITAVWQLEADAVFTTPMIVVGAALTYSMDHVVFSLTRATRRIATFPDLYDNCTVLSATPVNQRIGTMRRRRIR